jgi:hypothetical protein
MSGKNKEMSLFQADQKQWKCKFLFISKTERTPNPLGMG